MTQKPIYLLCTVLLYFVGIFFFPSFFFLLKNFPCTTLHALRRACSSSYSSSFLNSPKNMACSTCNAIYRLPKELLYQHHQKEKWWAETPKTLGLFFLTIATNEEGCTIYFVVLRLKGWLSILPSRRQTSYIAAANVSTAAALTPATSPMSSLLASYSNSSHPPLFSWKHDGGV